jgi:hypothetical protein
MIYRAALWSLLQKTDYVKAAPASSRPMAVARLAQMARAVIAKATGRGLRRLRRV